MGVSPEPNLVSPEWRCPLNRGVPKERFHCNSKLYLHVGVWCLDIPLKKVAELTCKLSPETLFAAALLAPSCAPFDALWAAAPPKVKTITALHKTGLQLGCNKKIRNHAALAGHIMWLVYCAINYANPVILTMFYQVSEDDKSSWNFACEKNNNNNKINKNKGVKFCPVILTKKKTNRNKQKGQLVWHYTMCCIFTAYTTAAAWRSWRTTTSYPNARAGQNWHSENWAQVYSLNMVDTINF